MAETMIWVYAGLVGGVVGSFLNVCLSRLPEGESVITPRSRCPACGAGIAWYDNVPVVSFALLGGRCRGCRTAISWQYPIIEFVTAVLWVAAAVQYGASVPALSMAAFFTLLLGIALIDARHFIIPDQFSITGAILGLGFAAVPGGFPFTDALLGAAVGYALMGIVAVGGKAVFRKPALGTGDIFMMGMVGAFLGISGVLLTVLLGSVLGLVIGVPVMAIGGRLRRQGTYLPLGTFLAMGAAVTHAWGDVLINWYLAYALGG